MPIYKIEIPELHYSTRIVQADCLDEAHMLAGGNTCCGMEYIDEVEDYARKESIITEDEAAHIKGNNSIAITWTIEDVRHCNKHLNDRMCRDILGIIDRRHDANLGVCWDIIHIHVNDYLSKELLKELCDAFDEIDIDDKFRTAEQFEEFKPGSSPSDIWDWLEELFETEDLERKTSVE